MDTHNDFPVENAILGNFGVAEHRPREVVAVTMVTQRTTRYIGAVWVTCNEKWDNESRDAWINHASYLTTMIKNRPLGRNERIRRDPVNNELITFYSKSNVSDQITSSAKFGSPIQVRGRLIPECIWNGVGFVFASPDSR